MQWRRLLWPLSLIYDSITRIRNTAFDQGLLPSRSFPIPVITIGNLSTGGTGKTPMVEFLLDKLKIYERAVVSRGYGRKTTGLLIATPEHTARDIGDEPLQLYRKFPDIRMVLSEKRVQGLEALQTDPPEVVILDDAFQHRYVKPGFQVLLTTFQNPFYYDLILPAGNLRESSKGKSRAHTIVVSKCPPHLNPELAEVIRRKIKPDESQNVFFTTLQYGAALNPQEIALPPASEVLLVSGIAHPKPFLEHSRKAFKVKQHLNFADHHDFSQTDIRKIKKRLTENPAWCVLTTEKDRVRLLPLLPEALQMKVFSVGIEVKFLFNGEQSFMDGIHNFISQNTSQNNL